MVYKAKSYKHRLVGGIPTPLKNNLCSSVGMMTFYSQLTWKVMSSMDHGSSHHQAVDDLGYPHDKTETPMTALSESITDKSDPTDPTAHRLPHQNRSVGPVGPVGPQAAANWGPTYRGSNLRLLRKKHDLSI